MCHIANIYLVYVMKLIEPHWFMLCLDSILGDLDEIVEDSKFFFIGLLKFI